MEDIDENGLCDECGNLEELEDMTSCSICKIVYFCEGCVREITKYNHLLECVSCRDDLAEHLSEYDESVEREQIGHREGGRDPYDNQYDY